MSQRAVDLVLFDAVGTLIEPSPSVAEVYQSCGSKFGSSLSSAEIRARFAQRFRESYDSQTLEAGRSTEAAEYSRWQAIVGEVFCELDARAGGLLFKELWAHFAEPASWRVYPEVAATLGELRRRGYRLGIASNFDRRLLTVCQGHGCLADFDWIFLSSEVGWSKPAEGFYRTIEQRTAISRERLMLIGDDYERDCRAPRAFGWQARWLCRSSAKSAPEHYCSLSKLLAELS